MLKSLLLAAALLLGSLPTWSITPQEVYDSSVVVVISRVAKDGSPDRSQCSGTIIAKLREEYLALTAAHCAGAEDSQGAWNYQIASDAIAPFWTQPARVFLLGDFKTGQDYMLLAFHSRATLKIMELERSQLKPGDRIQVASTPDDSKMKIYLEGVVAKEAHYTEDSFWPVSVLAQVFGLGPGASGAGVINAETGRLCGIVVGGTRLGILVILPISVLGAQFDVR